MTRVAATEFRWVNRRQVVFIHELLTEMGGGSHGLRDPAMLESAFVQPQIRYSYGQTDTFRFATSYAEAISRKM